MSRFTDRTDAAQREQAMQWLLRLREDPVDESDVAQWVRWYEASDGNRTAFDALHDFWQRSGELAEDAARAESLRRMAYGTEAGAAGPLRGLAAAMRRAGRVLAAAPLRPAPAAALLVLLLCASAAVWLRPGRPPLASPPAANVAAPAGEAEAAASPRLREATLPDGSKVELAAKSSIEVDYTDARRGLRLGTGEAYFTVAPNRARPFVVRVGALDVRAVGTEFNIRHADARVVVTVVKGVVDVYPAAAGRAGDAGAGADLPRPGGVRVNAGNEVTWIERAAAPTVVAVDTAHAVAWKQGRLEYIDEPLAAVIADVNRYASRPIVVRDGRVARLSYTGTVLTGAIDEWLRSLPGVFPVEIEPGNGQDNSVLAYRDGGAPAASARRE